MLIIYEWFLREQIAQAGFTEALTFSLCSRDDVSTKVQKI